MPNGIDGSRLETARGVPPGRLRDELGLSGDDYVFLNVASIHATKAQHALVVAFARYWRRTHMPGCSSSGRPATATMKPGSAG